MIQRDATDPFKLKLASIVLLLFLVRYFLPFFLLRENRISPEIANGMGALDLRCRIFLLLPFLLVALYASVKGDWLSDMLLSLAGTLGLFFPMMVLAIVGGRLSGDAFSPSRYGPASGMYVYLTAVLVIFMMKPKVKAYDLIGIALVIGSVLVAGYRGSYDRLGLLLEARNFGTRLNQELVAHIRLTLISLAISIAIGLPLALVSYQSRRAEKIIFPFLNILQTIPGIALLGLLITPLSTLSRTFPLLRELGIKGIGNTPAIIALTTYALYPIIRYSFTAFSSIDQSVIQAARGMGMSPSQVWKLVRFPLATPGVLQGMRVALVQTIGNATLAKLIGGDGLGVLVFEGLGQASVDMVLLGMGLIIGLTVISDRLFQILITLTTPRSLRAKGVGNG